MDICFARLVEQKGETRMMTRLLKVQKASGGEATMGGLAGQNWLGVQDFNRDRDFTASLGIPSRRRFTAIRGRRQ